MLIQASFCVPLSRLCLCWYSFWSLTFSFVCFPSPFLLLFFSTFLSSFFSYSLYSSLLAWDSEKGGLGTVCLKPSRVNLLRPSTVRKDCKSLSPPSPPPLFFNPGHFSREKWLPSLFSSFFLESRKQLKIIRKCYSDSFYLFSFH